MWTILLNALLFACGTPGRGAETMDQPPQQSLVPKPFQRPKTMKSSEKERPPPVSMGAFLSATETGLAPKDAIGLWLEAAVRRSSQ